MRRRLAKLSPLAWILEYQPKILFPGKGLIAFEPYPFQQDFINSKDTYRAINKPRQCGISTAVAAEVAWEFCHVPGAQIVVISKDLEAALNFAQYVYAVLDSVADEDPNFPAITRRNRRTIENANSSRITILASSKSTGRSFSATHLIFDEMAFAEYADKIWESSSPTLSRTGGRATIISTPNGRANMFYRIFEARNHLGFKTFDYKWWDVPDYNCYYDEYIAAVGAHAKKKIVDRARRDSRWYAVNRATKTDMQWAQEFEGAFDASENMVFSTRSIEKTFWATNKFPGLEYKQDDFGLLSEWWTKPKLEGHYYATGADLGRKNDATVIFTYDYTTFPAELVDFKYIEAGRLDWELIERVYDEHLLHWNPVAQHDGTGIGDSFSGKFAGRSDGFVFTKSSKQNIIQRMQHAFDSGMLRIPKIDRIFHEHQRYQWDDNDIVQDTVMANVMAVALFYNPEGASIRYLPLSYVGA